MNMLAIFMKQKLTILDVSKYVGDMCRVDPRH